ncbi:unnamed protein product [Brassica rapa subsp. narinosa]|nr:unnamed protein product [Brassica napus]
MFGNNILYFDQTVKCFHKKIEEFDRDIYVGMLHCLCHVLIVCPY